MVKLHDDWRKILRHAWSIRLLAVAALFQGAEVVMPLLQSVVAVPAGVFLGLSALATSGAFITRLLSQQKFGGQ